MIPLLLATNTRPSGAKRITVGLPSPLQTVVSLKPAGSVPASAALAIGDANGSAARAVEATLSVAATAQRPASEVGPETFTDHKMRVSARLLAPLWQGRFRA